ncbi:hypothetical protein [Marinimicrobium sp. ABcell2]|uniref:hypothetical protein n=1 Tax=Marinimicrobium sp. ABcell2 TaxID=3069751 RepID=UPI0027AF36F8|nr:hypothetical protein [Marinimicrobium sp. ABcell2]MDQ2076620.1 hypothetical protein [Marinimicrobium sp. ABcell2]
MISETLALATGAVVGAVSTAGIYRSSQAANVRRAIASVLRYLDADSHKPLGDLAQKLKLHLELVNEADDLVARSDWAKKQKRRFVMSAVEVIKARNKGVTKANQNEFLERQGRLQEAGELLLGYMQFPSLLWVKATLFRMISRWR